MSGKELVVLFVSASIAGLLLSWLIVLPGERYIANGRVDPVTKAGSLTDFQKRQLEASRR
jgi:hypothetical protein